MSALTFINDEVFISHLMLLLITERNDGNRICVNPRVDFGALWHNHHATEN